MPKYSTESIRTVALVGHTGAGKTTLAEALLTKAGAIPSAGSVERGNTVCDFDPLEKEYKHSLNSAIVNFSWKNTHIHLIDTPGSPDFMGQAIGARRPGGGGGRGIDGEVPRAGRSSARAAARALREGAARRPPDPGVLHLGEERRGGRGAARHPRQPRAERDRGQRAAVPEGRGGAGAGVLRRSRPQGARARARLQGDRRSLRRQGRRVPRAPGDDHAEHAALRRRRQAR